MSLDSMLDEPGLLLEELVDAKIVEDPKSIENVLEQYDYTQIMKNYRKYYAQYLAAELFIPIPILPISTAVLIGSMIKDRKESEGKMKEYYSPLMFASTAAASIIPWGAPLGYLAPVTLSTFGNREARKFLKYIRKLDRNQRMQNIPLVKRFVKKDYSDAGQRMELAQSIYN